MSRVADRLDVPVDYVVASVEGPAQARNVAVDTGRDGSDVAAPPATRLDAEGIFLALCAAGGAVGQSYLARVTDSHLSSTTLRRARDHLIAHPGDPLADLPEDDRDLAGLLTALAVQADAAEAPGEARLHTDFLHLDRRRIERELRHARADGDFARQGALAADLQRVRGDLDAAIGRDGS